jgi:hypothetical protein
MLMFNAEEGGYPYSYVLDAGHVLCVVSPEGMTQTGPRIRIDSLQDGGASRAKQTVAH